MGGVLRIATGRYDRHGDGDPAWAARVMKQKFVEWSPPPDQWLRHVCRRGDWQQACVQLRELGFDEVADLMERLARKLGKGRNILPAPTPATVEVERLIVAFVRGDEQLVRKANGGKLSWGMRGQLIDKWMARLE